MNRQAPPSLVSAEDFVFIYVIYPNHESAQSSAREAVTQNLCACANLWSEHQSIYRWKEKIEETREVAVLFKTAKAREELLSSFIKSTHPFETPCIATFGPDRIDASFADWIKSAT